MPSPAQLRAARGLLDWTRADLAKAASISPETIKNIEHGTFRPQESTAEAIVRAFRARDVEFTENEGVQKHKELVKTYIGHEGYKQVLDDIFDAMKTEGGITRHFNFSDNLMENFTSAYSKAHLDRMGTIKNLDAKCLIPYGDTNFAAKYGEYRWLRKDHTHALPYYLFGNHVIFYMKASAEDVMIVSIYSEQLIKSLIQQFDAFWQEAVVPTK
ncbi:MAG: helix-turn-helix domain-containing protein [Alphaproteobacteria bacterium]|nr:helix-turn-helix domain-containing protein [Alphaproteobacteria bacterium]